MCTGVALLLLMFVVAVPTQAHAGDVSQTILDDSRLETVLAKARQLMRGGFSAGGGYPAVFIRDYNTFMLAACEVVPAAKLKAQLLPFFELQSTQGNIPDTKESVVPEAVENGQQVAQRWTEAAETDQGSSLVQAVSKYVRCSRDTTFLSEPIKGQTVLQRMRLALDYVEKAKLDAEHGLVTGGTTIDWGDVQPESDPGGDLGRTSHLSMSIYDNAMFLIAIDDFTALLKPTDPIRQSWLRRRRNLASNVRRYLWDEPNHKFIPHIYVAGSPFPRDFNESAILFEGGTAVAIEAGLLSNTEILQANAQMVTAQQKAHAPSITGSIYPPYPSPFFKNGIVCEFCYQNGAAWPWFAARMVRQLSSHGMLQEAYDELQPMLDQVLRDGDFFEYYTLSNKPAGSSGYRGGAGVLLEAIESVQDAAKRRQPFAAPRKPHVPRSQAAEKADDVHWSYNNLPPNYAWHAEKDPRTSDIVYYGVAPATAQPPLLPGDFLYVGPDSMFYYFRHPPPLAPSDLLNRWFP